ncbi:MAG: hypothetical protein Kow0069_33140 [Promethearchaeota archaeon]
MGTLIDWFKQKNRADALAKTRVHVQKVLECVAEAEKALRFFLEGKFSEALAVVQRVGELEHDGDNLRREILKDLSRGELASNVRADLTHLVKRVDDVAGAANASAKFMSIFPAEAWLKIREHYAEQLTEMMALSTAATRELVDMLDDLAGERVFISEISAKVNKHEHDVDVIHFNVKKSLVEVRLFGGAFPGRHFLSVHFLTLLDIMESITDCCEEVADYVVLLAISAK